MSWIAGHTHPPVRPGSLNRRPPPKRRRRPHSPATRTPGRGDPGRIPRKRRHSPPARFPLNGSDPPGIAYRDDIRETLPTSGKLSVTYRLTGIHWYRPDAIGEVYLGRESYSHALRYREGRKAIRIVTRPALLLLAIAAFYLVFALTSWHDRHPLPGSYFDRHPLPGQHQIVHVPF